MTRDLTSRPCWFYEETRHPQALARWLAQFGVNLSPQDMVRSRAAAPFMKSRFGTLVTNVISEMIASAGYMNLSLATHEPVLQKIARNLAGDEARHASGFYCYAGRQLSRSSDVDADRGIALKVLHLWLRDAQHVGHPVNQFYNRREGATGTDDRLGTRLALTATRSRVCRMVGTLVDVDLDGPDDVLPAIRRLSPSAAGDSGAGG